LQPSERAARVLRAADFWLYALVGGACTLWVARLFYASMREQLALTGAGAAPGLGDWSAPLDDVFIHFDVARATARGFPLQWSEGNGYSSGGTSLLYPLVLAFGYWVGFRGLRLMLWAAIVACVSVLATMLGARRLFLELPRWTAYLAPVALLSLGALDWSLFSGMEVALLLALWSGALVAWDALSRRASDPQARLGGWALALGGWAALLVATRPEAAVLAALFGVWAAVAAARARGRASAVRVLLAAGLPPALLLGALALANLAFTGDAAAAGALVKLEIYHPRLTPAEVWDFWTFHLRYQLLRVTTYHMADVGYFGWIPWGLALAGVIARPTRRAASLLLGSALAWALIVALNGQVRWQNERYAMPAVAWVLLAAALGAAALLHAAFEAGPRRLVMRVAAAGVALGALGLYAAHQWPRLREQVWFFGRASRNIRDQHLTAGAQLRRLRPAPQRLGVGDAGAIPYAADLPALDLIGLGGYGGLPFARATRWGTGASLELVERIPARDRPDVLALYPSWWDRLPLWFGERVSEVGVRGNVICAGLAKVIYRADWSPLDRGAAPVAMRAGERVADVLDFADLVSEREHAWRVERPAIPVVEMKLLPDPKNLREDLWDAGRTLQDGEREHFRLRGLAAGRPLRLVVRAAPARASQTDVRLDGAWIGRLQLEPADAWVERSVEVPVERVGGEIEIELATVKGERILYHLWAVQR
jgi:hypothetical protein